MKKISFILLTICSIVTTNHIAAKLNNFGISNLVPSHDDDNDVFDLRIEEEMLNGKKLNIHGRHVTNLQLQDILQFIPKISIYFEHLLDTHNKNTDALNLARLAIIDVKKAKKMLRPQDVSGEDENDMRAQLWKIESRINAYFHVDNVEASSYIKSKKKTKSKQKKAKAQPIQAAD